MDLIDRRDFEIPEDRSELLNTASGVYSIDVVLPLENIDEELQSASKALKSTGPAFIIEHFPTYFAILTYKDEIEINIVNRALLDLSQALKQMSKIVRGLLKDTGLTSKTAKINLKILKMLMYAYTNLLILLDTSKNEADVFVFNEKKTKKIRTTTNDFDKIGALKLISNILDQEIFMLWNPPICDQSFVNIIADVLYTYLQNHAIKNDLNLQNALFRMFGDLLKNYNYSFVFKIKMVQVIRSKHNEHLCSLIPQGLKMLVEEYSCKSLIKEFVQELTEWQAEENTCDAPGVKHCSTILVNMAILMPHLMIPEVICLLRYLNHESYILRTCIITIITEVLVKVLSKEDMNEENLLIRDLFFKQLDLHILDTNAFVRAKVLQLWGKLQYEKTIPVTKLAGILEKTSGRLMDRAIVVRKNAIVLLAKFVESNPFTDNLNLEMYENYLEKETHVLENIKLIARNITLEIIQNKEDEWSLIENNVRLVISNKITQANEMQVKNTEFEVKDTEKIIRMYLEEGKYEEAFIICQNYEDHVSEMKEARKKLEEDQQVEFFVTFLHGIYSDVKNMTTQEQPTYLVDDELRAKIEAAEKKVAYLQNVVAFLRVLDKSIPKLLDLLESAVMSDVTEAVEFFIIAHRFQLNGSLNGLEVMLEIIRPDQNDTKNIVADAYKRLFLENGKKNNAKETGEYLVKGLIKVLKSMSLTSLPSFGSIVSEWVSNGLVNINAIEYLWQMFTGTSPNITKEDTRAALQLLTFIGVGRPSIVERNVNLVVEFAFKETDLDNIDLVVIACEMLSHIGNNGQTLDVPKRIGVNDMIWEKLMKIVVNHFVAYSNGMSSLIQAAVQLIYKLCRFPDVICEKIVRTLHPILTKSENITDSTQLTSLVYMLGEIALKQFEYLDITVYRELKRRNNIRTKNNKKIQPLAIKKSATSIRRLQNDIEETYSNELPSEDLESEFVLKVCEKEIVNTNLLGHFVPMLIDILRNPIQFDDENLQTATSLTMMRYMIISEMFCKNNIPLMMTVLDETYYAGVKNNILISISDLLHRHPNIIEPCTAHLYKCVRDSSQTVRLTAVSVLTSLLVQHMLRVKGNIAEIALCINDESENIREIVTKFFFSLSQQTINPVYYILPDIISNLSSELHQVDEEQFRNVMRFLIKHINKDKQVESLVEKLCVRIGTIVNRRHLRDVTYCLTLLDHSERSFEKIISYYPIYKLQLEDQDVFHLFVSIVERYKALHKEDMKNAVRRLDELLKSGSIEEENLISEPQLVRRLTRTRQKRQRLF